MAGLQAIGVVVGESMQAIGVVGVFMLSFVVTKKL
jgi:hypothetical protein